jgi:hypothetical protein
MSKKSVIDLNSFLYYYGHSNKGVINEYRKNSFFSSYRLFIFT